MSKWKNSDNWSFWVCAHDGCGSECFDPDTVTVTTCVNGHTNYLEPADSKSQHRRAFKTAKERAKEIREHNAIVAMFSDAIRAGRKTLEKQGKKPQL